MLNVDEVRRWIERNGVKGRVFMRMGDVAPCVFRTFVVSPSVLEKLHGKREMTERTKGTRTK